MSSLQISILVIIIIVVIVLILFIYLSTAYPGLFVDWKRKSSSESHIVTKDKILSSNDINTIKNTINNDDQRQINIAMSVIGTAAYIDPKENYEERCRITNPLLREKYGILYQKLLSKLENMINGDNGENKCIYAADRTKNKIALPGFHIFNSKSPLAKGWAVASLHVDKQEELISWPENEIFDMEKTLSYTLAIDVPEDSGLYVTNLKDNNSYSPLWWRIRNSKIEKVSYQNGYCYLHHGKYFHMISPFVAKESTTQRITLQGHAIFCKSRHEWWLYW